MNTYEINIDNFLIDRSLPQDRCVIRVVALITATAPDGIVSTAQGVFDVPAVEGEAYIPYENITMDIAKAWIRNDTTRWNEITQMLDAQIDADRAVTTVVMVPPWILPAPTPEPVISDTLPSPVIHMERIVI